ncbi:MAG: copper chaperone PCu(A)C [Streptosporangiaceae bacterium]|nr:copper chaperone PCu(A)C [Streptosporangiaceae bacterium]
MRRLMPAFGIAGAAMLAALGVTGCTAARAAPSIFIASAYVPQPTTPGTTVAYLDIRNDGPADRLVAVHTSVGGTVVLRAPAGRHGSVLAMRTVPDIPVPADSMTELDPDGFHLLITGAGPMRDGKDIMLRLTFVTAGTVTVPAMVTDPESGGSSYFLN